MKDSMESTIPLKSKKLIFLMFHNAMKQLIKANLFLFYINERIVFFVLIFQKGHQRKLKLFSDKTKTIQGFSVLKSKVSKLLLTSAFSASNSCFASSFSILM